MMDLFDFFFKMKCKYNMKKKFVKCFFLKCWFIVYILKKRYFLLLLFGIAKACFALRRRGGCATRGFRTAVEKKQKNKKTVRNAN